MLGRDDATTVAVIPLSARKYAFRETRRTQQHFANSRNFDNVYTDGKNHD